MQPKQPSTTFTVTGPDSDTESDDGNHDHVKQAPDTSSNSTAASHANRPGTAQHDHTQSGSTPQTTSHDDNVTATTTNRHVEPRHRLGSTASSTSRHADAAKHDPLRRPISNIEPAATTRQSGRAAAAIQTADDTQSDQFSTASSLSALTEDSAFIRRPYAHGQPVLSTTTTTLPVSMLTPGELTTHLEQVAHGRAFYTMTSSPDQWRPFQDELTTAPPTRVSRAHALFDAYVSASHVIKAELEQLRAAATVATQSQADLIQHTASVVQARMHTLQEHDRLLNTKLVNYAQRLWKKWSLAVQDVRRIVHDLPFDSVPSLPSDVMSRMHALRADTDALEHDMSSHSFLEHASQFVHPLQLVDIHARHLHETMAWLAQTAVAQRLVRAQQRSKAAAADLDAATAAVTAIGHETVHNAAAHGAIETDRLKTQHEKIEQLTNQAAHLARHVAAVQRAVELLDGSRERLHESMRVMSVLQQKTQDVLQRIRRMQIKTVISQTALKATPLEIQKVATAQAHGALQKHVSHALHALRDAFDTFVEYKQQHVTEDNLRFANMLHFSLQSYTLAEFTAALGTWTLPK